MPQQGVGPVVLQLAFGRFEAIGQPAHVHRRSDRLHPVNGTSTRPE